jgi:hypothetical protein
MTRFKNRRVGLKLQKNSTGRPFEAATGQKMDVEMRHGLAGIAAMVDDEAEAFVPSLNAELFGDATRGEQQSAERGLIFRHGLANTWDELLRHDQDVNGSLRINVVEGRDEVVLIDERRGDLTVDDFLENGLFAHAKASLGAV